MTQQLIVQILNNYLEIHSLVRVNPTELQIQSLYKSLRQNGKLVSKSSLLFKKNRAIGIFSEYPNPLLDFLVFNEIFTSEDEISATHIMFDYVSTEEAYIIASNLKKVISHIKRVFDKSIKLQFMLRDNHIYINDIELCQKTNYLQNHKPYPKKKSRVLKVNMEQLEQVILNQN